MASKNNNKVYALYIEGVYPVESQLTENLTIVPLRDCEVSIHITRSGSDEEYILKGHTLINFVARAFRLRTTA